MPPRAPADVVVDGVTIRTCSSCGEQRPLEDFAWQNQAAGRRHRRCKRCAAAHARDSRQKKIDHYRAVDRQYHHNNRERRNANRKKNYDPRRQKDNVLRAKYGISIEEYDAMAKKQGGRCAICDEPPTARNQHGVKPLVVDHSHVTGKVRGLLCDSCNVAIGHIREDRSYAEKLLAYVESHL